MARSFSICDGTGPFLSPLKIFRQKKNKKQKANRTSLPSPIFLAFFCFAVVSGRPSVSHGGLFYDIVFFYVELGLCFGIQQQLNVTTTKTTTTTRQNQKKKKKERKKQSWFPHIGAMAEHRSGTSRIRRRGCASSVGRSSDVSSSVFLFVSPTASPVVPSFVRPPNRASPVARCSRFRFFCQLITEELGSMRLFSSSLGSYQNYLCFIGSFFFL